VEMPQMLLPCQLLHGGVGGVHFHMGLSTLYQVVYLLPHFCILVKLKLSVLVLPFSFTFAVALRTALSLLIVPIGTKYMISNLSKGVKRFGAKNCIYGSTILIHTN
jgi:hypothetical protein